MTLTPRRASGPYRPTRLGQWEVIAKIAGGGMSAVYLGRRVDSSNDLAASTNSNVVALKIVRHDAKDQRFVQMFLEEGRLLARLVHPNIVRTLEVGADAEQDFIAMELMLGKPFSAIHDALVARSVRLNPEIAAWSAARIADALHYAHELADEHGRPLALVHRDVNPANVFATFNGEVKLFDFGLAKVTADDPAGSKIVAGKLSYLSPEQIMSMPLDRRSDIFSLGTTLWELLTSRRLFRRDTDVETVRAVQLGPIPDLRAVAHDLPEELARIARRALERNRDHRYPTADQLARELDAFVYSRSSPDDISARLAKLVDTLFPDEFKRQSGWLKPAIAASRSMAPPRRDSRETTAVMTSAPPPPPSNSALEADNLATTAPDGFPALAQEHPSAPPTARDGSPVFPSPPAVPTVRDAALSSRAGGASVRPSPATSRPSVPPRPPASMPPRAVPSTPPSSRTDPQAAPPAPERPMGAPPEREGSSPSGFGAGIRPRARLPIPLPSRSAPPPRPRPRPSVAPPARPATESSPETLSVDTTEVEADDDRGS